MQRRSPTAVVIDADGELAIVRAMLGDLGVDHVHIQGDKAEPPLPSPRRLLIATAPQAIELGWRRSRKGDPATWLACARGRSKTQRTLLRQAGFDMLIPEDVHPAALLLLLRRAIFDGENTQRAPRVAVGQEVGYRTTLRGYRGLLLDLSARGCRLITDRRWPVGRRLSVQVPMTRPAGRSLTLRGEVIRVGTGPDEGGRDGEHSIAIRFAPMRRREQESLRAILRERLAGPAEQSTRGRGAGPATRTGLTLAAATTAIDPASASATPADSSGLDVPARFDREVTAICGGATRTLLGRDLSTAGMRVDPTARLEDGERVRLALHGAASDEPFLIEAHVERSPERVMIRFDYMEPPAREQLEALVASLPRLHRLEDDAPTHTAVVAQLFGRRR